MMTNDKDIIYAILSLTPKQQLAFNLRYYDEMDYEEIAQIGICEIRLEQQFLRLIDPRNDDNPNDAWCVLRGATGNNPYIGYAPVTNFVLGKQDEPAGGFHGLFRRLGRLIQTIPYTI